MKSGPTFGLKLQAAKNNFFDRAAVLKALSGNARRALSKFGAFVRQRARSSMRPGGKKGKTSPPGVPPRTHVGHLKRLLFFSWDPVSRSVVIGPIKFHQGNVPQLLEFGGIARIKSHGRTEVRRYKGNPYMQPALRAEVPNMPRAWNAAVRGA